LGEGHKSAFQDLAHQGVVNQAATNYAPYHYHNQFLDTLVKRGVLGLLSLLVLLATPVLIAFKYFRNDNLVLGSVCGITFMYTIASLTDVPFNHPTTINLFVLSMIALLSLEPDNPDNQGTQRTTRL
jgi:O-antigen ligase